MKLEELSNKGDDLKRAIDKAIEDKQEGGFRDHLGASVVGRMCEREIWYIWRWAVKKKHEARILRLFDRGHKEEYRFEEWLEPVCEKFWANDPRTGEQIRVSDFYGYFGGSLDGVMRNPHCVDENGDFLTEFKTHNEKSFLKLLMGGVQKEKPEHYVQMQLYLHYKPKLKGAYYFAVNKNDDQLYVEYVERDQDTINTVFDKIKRILKSKTPPPKFDKASENHFVCKYFCDFKKVCWNNKEPEKTCRSCAFINTTNKGFTCGKTQSILSSDEQRAGCDLYERGY